MLTLVLLVKLTVRTAFMARTWGGFPIFLVADPRVKISHDFRLAQPVSPLPQPCLSSIDVFHVSTENTEEHLGHFCVTWEVRDGQ